jgi:hypothetical protein
MIWLTRRVMRTHRRAEEIVHDYASFLLRESILAGMGRF